jgi:hypothetical protein
VGAKLGSKTRECVGALVIGETVGTNTCNIVGASVDTVESKALGALVGEGVEASDGITVFDTSVACLSVGTGVCDSFVGPKVGVEVGIEVGIADDTLIGLGVRLRLGTCVGIGDGASVDGASVGIGVGRCVGIFVGPCVGSVDGTLVGIDDGTRVGTTVGIAVGVVGDFVEVVGDGVGAIVHDAPEVTLDNEAAECTADLHQHLSVCGWAWPNMK